MKFLFILLMVLFTVSIVNAQEFNVPEGFIVVTEEWLMRIRNEFINLQTMVEYLTDQLNEKEIDAIRLQNEIGYLRSQLERQKGLYVGGEFKLSFSIRAGVSFV